jgi:hypothetical protein
MDSVFIDDGQTREGFVAAKAGLHGELKFQFRPALAEERFQFARENDADGRAYARRAAKLLEKHVTGWSSQVALKLDHLLKLHPDVLNAMLDQVLGYSPAMEAADAKN